MADLEAFLGQRLEGTVASFKEQWGWVSCPAFGADVFAHRNDVASGSLSSGAELSFELGVDEKSGRPRARQIEVLVAGSGIKAGVSKNAARSRQAVADPGGARVEGVVSTWKEPWGWVSCDLEEKDIFAHREDIISGDPFAPLEAGQVIYFSIGTDAKTGRRRALQIELPGQEDRFQGVVATWKDQWGWISCPDIPDGDIFAHREDLTREAFMEPGTPVSFEVGTDAKGRRRAKKIGTAGGSKGGGGGGKGCGPAAGKGGCKGGPIMPMAYPKGGKGGSPYLPIGYGGGGKSAAPSAHYPQKGGKGGPPGPGAYMGERLDGLVASWKDQWGWVSSPLFATDIFAHVEDLPEGVVPSIGVHVTFTVGSDKKGRVRAKQIHMGPRPGPAPNAAQKKRKKAIGGAASGAGEAADGVDLASVEGLMLEGQVASWKSPWGWINASDFGKDLFAHQKEVVTGEDLVVGQSVSFVVGRDEKSGRWRALQISPGEQPELKKLRV